MPRKEAKKKDSTDDGIDPIEVDGDSDEDYVAERNTSAQLLIPQTRHVPRTAPKAFIAQLKGLEAVENKHAGTQEMIRLIHRISRQKWTTFHLRYDEGDTRPHPHQPMMETFYATSTLTRWELVEDMLQFAFLHQEVVEDYGEDYELYWSKSGTTEQISVRMVTFMGDVYRKGETIVQGRKPQTLVMREWCREGTWETLSASHIVPQEDLAEERGEGEAYPLRIW